jgi:hypothetical protein
MDKLAYLLSLVILGPSLFGCGTDLNPGSISFSLAWQEPPKDTVWLWLRVEERPDGADVPGGTLSSVGPTEYTHNTPFEATLGEVPNGKNRVLVIEAREGASTALPILYFGFSEPFEMGPGIDNVVEVPLTIQKPETESHEATLKLFFNGETRTTVSPDELAAATIQTRSAAASAITLANDASFSANLTTIALGEQGEADCTTEEVDGVVWDLCEVPDWNLGAGLADLSDGQYTVYARFVDQYGYESQIYKAAVYLDSTGPILLVSSISPTVAHAGQQVVVSATFHELLATEDGAQLTTTPDPGSILQWEGPEQIGNTNAYIWTATVQPEENIDNSIFTLEVKAVDPLENSSTKVPLTDTDGTAHELRLDASSPQLLAPQEIQFSGTIFGIPDEETTETFWFEFALQEANAHPLDADANGECIGTCPEVRISGKKLGKVLLQANGDLPPAEQTFNFRFEYDVTAETWGTVDIEAEVSIFWSDVAGNSSEKVLPQTIRLDFVRPQEGSCSLSPQQAGPDGWLIYSVTPTEPLSHNPELACQKYNSDGDLVDVPWTFFQDLSSPELNVYQWSASPTELEEGDYEVLAHLTDIAGNISDTAVCFSTWTVDLTSPRLSDSVVTTPSNILFGIPDQTQPDAGLLQFNFAVVERAFLTFPADGEACTNSDQCPEVRLGGKKVGTLYRAAEYDGETVDGEWTTGFTFNYQLNTADWGDVDKEIEISISLTDLAGNTMEEELPDKVRFDFIRPDAAFCSLTPNPANAGDAIVYSVTASEPLAEVPTFYGQTPSKGFTFNQISPTGPGDQTFSWQTDVPTVFFLPEPLTFSIGATFTDLAGNTSAEPMCTETIDVDLIPPEISALTVSTIPEVKNASGETVLVAGPDHMIKISFVVKETQTIPWQFLEVKLSLPGDPIPFGIVSEEEVEEGKLMVFEMNYAHFILLFNLEGTWAPVVTVEDTAGNRTTLEGPSELFVRLDATPPVAECALVPPPPEAGYSAGSPMTLVISPLEELEAGFVPTVDEIFEPAYNEPVLQFKEGTAYSFTGLVPLSDSVHEFELKAQLRDLVGNETPEGETACTTGTVTGTVDAAIPKLVSALITNMDNGMSGDMPPSIEAQTLRLDLTLSGTQIDPAVALGQGQMTAQEGPIEEGPGQYSWIFERTLTGDEMGALGTGSACVTVSGQDEAGNSYSIESFENSCLELDFDPPQATCFMSPASAKLGDTITLTVATSENITGQPQLETDASFGDSAEDEGMHFTYHQLVEGPEQFTSTNWTYQVDLTDDAGNTTVAACSGGGKVDFFAPEIIGSAEGIYISDDRPMNGEELIVAFSVADDELEGLTTTVKLGNTEMSPALNHPLGNQVFTHHVDSNSDPADTEGIWPISVTLTDAAGNQSFYSPGTVTYDFNLPYLVGDPEVNLNAPATCPYDSLQALSAEAWVDIAISVDDVLLEAPKLKLESAATGTVWLDNTDSENPFRTTFNYRFTEGVDGSIAHLNNGTLAVTITLTDLSGNTETYSVAQIPYDTEFPAVPDVFTDKGIVYRRVPWGSDSTLGKPQFELQGIDGSIEPGAGLIVLDGKNPISALEVSRTTADSNGAFGTPAKEGTPFVLGQADRPEIYLLAYDNACNSSGIPVRVREFELVATLGNKVTGENTDNPNEFEVRPWFTNRLWQPDAHEPVTVADLGTVANGGITTEGTGDWHERARLPDKPPGQWDREGAYDSWRDRWVIITPNLEGEERATTWEWDGSGWHLRLPLDPEGDGEPIPREWEGMAFDPVRGKTVLFGGNTFQGQNDETWEWDGLSWALRTPTDPEGDGNPFAREKLVLAYDAAREEVILFGGYNNGYQEPADTWGWNGSSWRAYDQPENKPLPPARGWPGFAYDPLRERIVMAGGHGNDYYYDVWEWDGAQWTEIAAQPDPEHGQPLLQYVEGTRLVWHPVLQKILLVGGFNGSAGRNWIWSWDGSAWDLLEQDQSNPSASVVHPGVFYHEGLQTLVIESGLEYFGPEEYSREMWFWDGLDTWSQWEPTPNDSPTYPEGNGNMVMRYDTTRAVTWLLSGGATWGWDGYRWTRNDQLGFNEKKASFEWDPVDEVIWGFINQGVTLYSYEGVVSTWNGQLWTPIEPLTGPDDNPNFILESTLTYHPLEDYFVIFGGQMHNNEIGSYTSDQTWIWDRAGWTLLKPEDLIGNDYPSHRQKHVSGWDPINQTIQVVSGMDYWKTSNNGQHYTNGFQWSFDGNGWTKVEPPDPENDGNPDSKFCGNNLNNQAYLMALDTQRGFLNIVGCPDGFVETVWHWNGTSWKNVQPADPENDGAPAKRIGGAMSYDSLREYLVYFGGDNSSDLWEWEAGVDARPGHVFRFSLTSLGLEESDQLHELDAVFTAQGLGDNQGMTAHGIDLAVWDQGTWTAVDSQQHAADEYAQTTWSTSAPDQLARLPVTAGRWLGFALTPIHINGPEYGDITTTYGEMTLRYRRN